jgi:hypothetical protein
MVACNSKQISESRIIEVLADHTSAGTISIRQLGVHRVRS